MIDILNSNYELIITGFTTIAVVIQFFNWWFLSKGAMKIVYVLSTIVYSCYIIIDMFLVLHDKTQWSMIMFVCVNIWALIMSIKGTLRMKNESRKK